MRRWIYEVIIVAVLVCIGLGIWRYVSTNDIRTYKKEVVKLRLYTEHQSLEIKVIEQAAKLSELKRDARRIKPSYKKGANHDIK